MGFVQWRPDFYVAGLDWPNGTHVSRLGGGVVSKFPAPHQVTNNFLMLLDEFFMYKEKAMA